tara:strand:+ start:489 stop:2045 length:1557 start_codon:yes stop_codon:yes gene_type:complete
MRSLPEALYSADAVRHMDRYLIDDCGVDGFELMQAAARAAFRQLVRRWPEAGPVLVLCGAGNNGGDGYLVAAHARRHGLTVECLAATPTDRLSGDARKAWQQAVADGVPVRPLTTLDTAALTETFSRAAVIVDALLGTGTTGAPRPPFDDLIQRCNARQVPVLAVDVPSGLDASTGATPGDVIRATVTVTFIARKAGLYTGQGPAVCGDIEFADLDTGHDPQTGGPAPLAHLLHLGRAGAWLPPRPANAHKGRFGHVLVVAGDRGMGGAGLMAAEAAVRSGAGLVSLATRPEHVSGALARCPSVMVHGIIHGSELAPLLNKASVVVCGPGIGQLAWGQQMLQQVLASDKPRVLDADALNLMANLVAVVSEQQVLTPHPGEAARLLNLTVAEVEADRVAAARKLQSLYGGVVLLKGAGTVVASSQGVAIVAGSNPGMATGGMGDVLSGVAGALCGQIQDLHQATVLAACAHLAAADHASRHRGYMGLAPTDVIEALPEVFRRLETDRHRPESGHDDHGQ